MKIETFYEQWKLKADGDPDIAAELSSLENDAEIRDRFYRSLEFGTGGLRGIIGAGTNRMNIYTVAQATQGIANFVNREGKTRRAAIAYDSRNKSELFARTAASVFAANGILAYIYPRLSPTPSLSFAVRELGCDVGIVITASHNPAEYNGYKVYGPDGCQITTRAAETILAEISKVDIFTGVKKTGFENSAAEGKIKYIEEEILEKYIASVLSERVYEGGAPLKIVYTPLNGAGLECVTKTLKRAGYGDVSVVAEQSEPDGGFPTCPYPNPEAEAAMSLGVKLCGLTGADLLLATDPDCDRVGTAVKSGGGYRLLNGNEIGVLLLDYICRVRVKQNTLPLNPVMVKTIVTTSLAERIADFYGVRTVNVLTGFKFIGEQIGELEKKNESGRYIFGFEESYGYLSGAYVRDKDAVNACLLICDMAAWYKKQNKTLAEALDDLYGRFGYFSSTLDSFTFEGEDGFLAMNAFMEGLRENPPLGLWGGKPATSADYLSGKGGLPPSNVLQFFPEENSIVTIRPSGTEPKLKIYCETIKESLHESREYAEYIREKITALVKK